MIRLGIRVPPGSAEQALAALLELAPTGLEQVDGPGFVEYALYGAPAELPALEPGPAKVGGVQAAVTVEEAPDDWAERWRRFHRPVLVAGRLYVRPPWEQPAVRPGVQEIVIDPGQAFGTGTHPTTQMCLELLLELAAGAGGGGAPGKRAARIGTAGRAAARKETPRGSFADLGCGSGLLAIAAATLGFDPVIAVDCDRRAIEATERNARENAVTLATIERHDLRGQGAPEADAMVANLMRPLLLALAERMSPRRSAALPRALVVSGLLDDEADEVAAAFAPLEEHRRLNREGWAALLLARRDG